MDPFCSRVYVEDVVPPNTSSSARGESQGGWRARGKGTQGRHASRDRGRARAYSLVQHVKDNVHCGSNGLQLEGVKKQGCPYWWGILAMSL